MIMGSNDDTWIPRWSWTRNHHSCRWRKQNKAKQRRKRTKERKEAMKEWVFFVFLYLFRCMTRMREGQWVLLVSARWWIEIIITNLHHWWTLNLFNDLNNNRTKWNTSTMNQSTSRWLSSPYLEFSLNIQTILQKQSNLTIGFMSVHFPTKASTNEKQNQQSDHNQRQIKREKRNKP